MAKFFGGPWKVLALVVVLLLAVVLVMLFGSKKMPVQRLRSS